MEGVVAVMAADTGALWAVSPRITVQTTLDMPTPGPLLCPRVQTINICTIKNKLQSNQRTKTGVKKKWTKAFETKYMM